jgi:hypothetical protein
VRKIQAMCFIQKAEQSNYAIDADAPGVEERVLMPNILLQRTA